MEVKLNADQEKAVREVSGFLLDDTKKEHVVSGAGGTGKTFTVGRVLDSLERINTTAALLGAKKLNKVYYTASTNKAAEVLSNASNGTASTIHNLLGLSVINDFRTGKTKLKKTDRNAVISDAIIVCDEASMVSAELKALIKQYTQNCKIIYTGDKYQLFPIGEESSPVFDDATISQSILLEPMRQDKDSPIYKLCTQFRKTVETGKFFPIIGSKGHVDYLTTDQYRAEIIQNFVHEPRDDMKILCYTNPEVIGYNSNIRKLRGLPATFTAGETIVSNNAAKSMSQDSMLVIEREYLIDDVSQIIEHPQYKFKCYYVWINGSQYMQPVNQDDVKKVLQHLAKKSKQDGDWEDYFHFKNNIADLRQKDASTVHKAQGSTYDTVYIDLNDIGKCFNRVDASRLLYVALSRPTTRIALYGKLPDYYGG